VTAERIERAADAATCAHCGAVLAQTAHGELCAACLFAAALPGASQQVGPYLLLQLLDEGGSGSVYIARRADLEELVAIKLARVELLGSSDDLQAFRHGLRLQLELRGLPNIVGTYDIGTHSDGRPYAVMPLLEGGTLADPVWRERCRDPRYALDLLITLAKAVSLAHQRGVLHCDLKPENVLFDAAGQAFVADFGLGRTPLRASGRVETHGGTLGFMAPEQVLRQELTTSSDVFSLGVLMYWLLTNELPFGEGDAFTQRVVSETAPRLAERYKGKLRYELDAICARALQRQPSERYRSAIGLADDLVRAKEGHPIEAERRQPLRVVLKWMRRHTIAALAVVELSLLLLYLPLVPLSVFREIKRTVRDQISFSAVAQAGAVMNELRATARHLEDFARDPEIKALVQLGAPYRRISLSTPLGGLDGLSIFSPEGVLQARTPQPRAVHRTLDFAFRDYFQGQLRLAQRGQHGVYVGRAFLSTGDEEPMLALSAPIYEGDKYIGALAGRIRARATFGAVQMNCGGHGACMTALLGPRDRDSASEPQSQTIDVLAAPGLADGREYKLQPKLAARICAGIACAPAATQQFEQPVPLRPLLLDDYEDPISGTRSMAALAPVGRTGLIVVIATAENALDAITQRTTERAKHFLWIPVLVGLLLLAAVVASATPRRE
jgi:serine/threonine protein kinase